MNEPTPEEAAAALRAVREGREQVIRSAVSSRWLSITGGLVVFVYAAVADLFPTDHSWLTWVVLAFILALVVALHTRVGSSLLGRPVAVSGRSLPLTFTGRLLRGMPVLGMGIIALIITLLDVPHGGIYYGALAALLIIFLGPRFQLWLLRRREKD